MQASQKYKYLWREQYHFPTSYFQHIYLSNFCAGALGVTASLNPNGVGLDTNPALVMGKPRLEFASSQVNLAQGSGQCYTTIKS